MELNEILKICLLAPASRCPASRVEMNGAVLKPQFFWREAKLPAEALILLKLYAPALIVAPAQLVMKADESGIYLVEKSREKPVYWISPNKLTVVLEEMHEFILGRTASGHIRTHSKRYQVLL